MKTLTTTAVPVERITRQFGFKKFDSVVTSITFSGRRTRTGPLETFVVPFPSQGWNRKNGSVTISNTAATWGWATEDFGVNVFDFQAETIRTVNGGLCEWVHNS